MRVAILTKRRTGLCAVLAAAAAQRKHDVDMLGLDNLVVDDALGRYDLVVVKSKQLYFLYAGLLAKALGVRVVPDPAVCKQVSIRIERPFVARRAGLAVPRWFFGAPDAMNARLREDDFPLVRKRIVGSGSVGVELVESKATLPQTTDQHLYLEQFVRGRHLLVYFVGDDTRVYEKRPFVSGREPVSPVALTDEVAHAVRRWRDATGLAFGHLDFVRDERTGALMLVDAGPFPQFRHWPGAAKRVSAIVLAHLPPS